MLTSFFLRTTASLPLLSYECVELESQVLEQANQLRPVLLDPHQRIEADGIRRDELLEFDSRARSFRACRQKLRDLRLTEVSGQMHHELPALTSKLYPAPHD
jgi:hypothetical protein